MANVCLEFKEYGKVLPPKLSGMSVTTNAFMTTLELTPLELALHAMCLGYLNRRELAQRKLTRHIQRVSTILSNVETDKKRNALVLSDDYFHSDSSEKRCDSYNLGMVMTRAVAAKYFGVPWICHTSQMKERHGYSLVPATHMKPGFDPTQRGSEADLIGFDSAGQPHFFEAKGTSSSKVLKKHYGCAINQASKSSGIDDGFGAISFATRNACCFSFGECFKGLIIDPPQKVDDNPDTLATGLYGCLFDNYSLYSEVLKSDAAKYYESDTISFRGVSFLGPDGANLLFAADAECLSLTEELRFGEYLHSLEASSRADENQANNRSWHYGNRNRMGEGLRYSAKLFAEHTSMRAEVYDSEATCMGVAEAINAKEVVIGLDGFILARLS